MFSAQDEHGVNNHPALLKAVNGKATTCIRPKGHADRRPGETRTIMPLGSNAKRTVTILFCGVALACAAVAESYSIPADKVDDQKIFWGNPAKFEKPAFVDYKVVVMATDEYKSIKQNKIETGSAKYWILISQASERAVKTVAAFGKESEYDLIVAKGYLEGLGLNVQPTDVTNAVLERLQKAK